jgi:uncharacterized protein
MTQSEEEHYLPERTCILTRSVREPERLLRFALSPEAEVTPDIKGSLPGRGAWVSADRASVEAAAKKRLFAKAFKAETKPAENLGALVDRLLEQDALSALSLANKAGAVTLGFMKVEALIGAGKAAAVLFASDGAEDGKRKIRQAIARVSAASGQEAADITQISLFSTAQMSLCLGRENVIHGALSGVRAADRFVEKCRRLVRYRVGVTSEPGLVLADNAGAGPSFI